MSCGVGHSRGSDSTLLWLWPVATAPMRPLAWEPPYATGAAQEIAKRQKKKKKKNDVLNIRLKNLNLIVGNKDQIFEQMTGWKLSVCQKSVIPAMACRVDIGKRVLAFK